MIIIIFFLLRINTTPPGWTNCKQNQTFGTCDGKQLCIDNCKENETRCGDICDKNCCDENTLIYLYCLNLKTFIIIIMSLYLN